MLTRAREGNCQPRQYREGRLVRVHVDPEQASPSDVIRTAAPNVALLILSERMPDALSAEQGSFDRAMAFLVDVADEQNKPVAVSFETQAGSRTCFLSPRAWTPERLKGWAGGHHEEPGAIFGTSTPVHPERFRATCWRSSQVVTASRLPRAEMEKRCALCGRPCTDSEPLGSDGSAT